MDYISTTPLYDSNYLAHYGIKGQKWGIRRFQNSDGTLTAAGQRRYSKELAKSIKKSGVWSRSKETEKLIKDKITSEDLKTIQNSSHKYREAAIELDKHDFYKSKEYQDSQKKAYSETLKYFEKYDPGYLKTIKDQSDDLLAFHDFRKMYEGYDDEYSSQAYNQYKNNPKHKSAIQNESKAWKEYESHINTVVNKILGKYGDTRIKETNEYGWDLSRKLGDIVGDELMFFVGSTPYEYPHG